MAQSSVAFPRRGRSCRIRSACRYAKDDLKECSKVLEMLENLHTEAHLAQSAERKALNLVVMGSSPMVGEFNLDGSHAYSAQSAPLYPPF